MRAVQLLPTKLLGVVADHGEFPIERIAVDRGGEGRWVGSAGHEEVLKLTDLKEVFEDEGGDEDEEDEEDEHGGEDDSDDEDKQEAKTEVQEEDDSDREDHEVKTAADKKKAVPEDDSDSEADSDSDEEQDDEKQEDEAEAAAQDGSSDEEMFKESRKRKKPEKDPLQATKRKKGRNEIVTDPSFFADL